MVRLFPSLLQGYRTINNRCRPASIALSVLLCASTTAADRAFSARSAFVSPSLGVRSTFRQYNFEKRNSHTMAAYDYEDYMMSSDPIPAANLPDWMRKERTRMLTSKKIGIRKESDSDAKSIVYWMQRDVRSIDNWALLMAMHLAQQNDLSLHVVHALPPQSPQDNNDDSIPSLENMRMTERHGTFLLGGLEHVHKELKAQHVPLHILRPSSHDDIANTFQTRVVETLSPACVICDFTPIRHIRQWTECQVRPSLEAAAIPMWQVDAHNVVPVWFAADKRQVGARTLRPKLHKLLGNFIQKFPKFKGNQHLTKPESVECPAFDRPAYETFLDWDTKVATIKTIPPGTEGAKRRFESFVTAGLSKFDQLRNDPNYRTICSNLSPWLNHGHMSFQRCYMAIKKLNKYATGSAAYIEEGLVRRELSDNYLFYTPEDYDQLSSAAGWAQETLETHASDEREYLYTFQELEQGETHDDLWNAAQMQLTREGGMHGFLRMYWAKKILEWTESPSVALATAQYFNDYYALDGRDPNGFVGVGWSIMGIHDQGWKEREIFGKIRYMNYAGCKRKFKVADFVAKYKGAASNAALAERKQAERRRQGKKRKAPA